MFRPWSEKSPRPSRSRLRHSLGLLLRPLGAAEGGSREAHGHFSKLLQTRTDHGPGQATSRVPFPNRAEAFQWELERQAKKLVTIGILKLIVVMMYVH